MPGMTPVRLAARIARDADTLLSLAGHDENMDSIVAFVRTGDYGRFFAIGYHPIGKLVWEVEVFLGDGFTHQRAQVSGDDDHWLRTRAASMPMAIMRMIELLPGVHAKRGR